VKKDKAFEALEAVHAALKPLNPEDRQRVLSSVRSLLEVTSPISEPQKLTSFADAPLASTDTKDTGLNASRKTSIRELIQDKKPGNHPEFITLFAYYREKYDNTPNFSRADLQQYYRLSREDAPGNYDRDFVTAVKNGWIHEEGEGSYITSKGIEAVESGFTSGRKPRVGRPRKVKGPQRAGKKRIR
jgi:hypothetical protein